MHDNPLKGNMSSAILSDPHPAQDGAEALALTPTQIGLLAESTLSGKPALNLLQIVIRFEGEQLDEAAIRAAWQDLASRHQALRLSLSPLDPSGPRQFLHSHVDADVQAIDWTDMTRDAQEVEFQNWLEEDRRRSVACDWAPCWRVRLFWLASGSAIMVFTFHHALLDGGGYRILLRDLFQLYAAHRDGLPLPERAGPDFADHCHALTMIDHDPARRFFREHLSGFETPNALDPVFTPAAQDALIADTQIRGQFTRRLPAALSDTIRARAARAGATTADFINAAWALVLARCTGRAEAIFGVTRSGRHIVPGGADIVGCRINTLPCRAQVAGQTLDGLLGELHGYSRAVRDHEHMPLPLVAELCDVPGGLMLFDSLVMFDRGSLPIQMRALGEEWANRQIDEYSQMATALSLSVYDDPEMLLRLEYDPARLTDEGAERIFDYLGNALRSMSEAGDVPLSEIDMLSAEERERLLRLGTPQHPTTDDPDGVATRFETVAARMGDRIAISQIGSSRQVSYAMLEARANHLARKLADQGVGKGDVVGLALPRGAEFIAAMLATLKADCAFLPLDPKYPVATLQDMIDRSGAVALFSAAAEIAHLGPQRIPVLQLDDPALAGQSDTAPARGAYDPERRAYVIFTSGSTGRPKGVEVPHRALSQHIQAITREFALTGDDSVLQFASLNFDVSIEEILPTLLSGARLVLRDDIVAQSISDLLDAFDEDDITVVNLPTVFWHLLVAHLDGTGDRLSPKLRLMVVGGERVSGDMLALWRSIHPEIRWLNGYGPTEATITSTLHDADDPPFQGGDVPVGRPTGHARAYLMSPDESLAPEGVGAELWLGGPAVASGYVGEPALTESAFPPDPFQPEAPDGGPIQAYRTGDKVSWLPEGVLAYHGRIDRQIKLRGYRIELAAIENALEADPAIATAVSTLDAAGGEDARLLAWVKLHEHAQDLSEAAVTEALRENLPAFMVPQIAIVEDFPQTPGGKIDVDRLPRPARNDDDDGEDAAPVDETTARVQQIFGALLGRRHVDPERSFFDLGGNSLLSVRLMGMLERQFGQRLSLATLYEAPCARQIAERLRRLDDEDIVNCLVPFQPHGSMPPLFAVHILGERGVYFRPMAALLGQNQPLIGLTLDLLDPSTPTSLPKIAAIYRANIERYYPTGPVQLIAVSQGSYIAFELAQQLLAAGRDVAALYLLDAEGPGGRLQRKTRTGLRASLGKLRRNFRGIVIGKLQKLRGEMSFRFDRLRLSLSRNRWTGRLISQPQTVSAHQAAIDLAIAEYQPTPYPRELTLFVGRDNPLDTPEGIASGLGWRDVAPAGIRIIETAGIHLSMVYEPHLHELIDHLAVRLQQISAIEP
ncbi:amino acid adenylation domain-containing protein [Paracoccus sp. YLB-12]|uniref:Amino acid adenylation domain-containing protein n=1 Tax=Paracoccus maritimus TaxID=2933292 RepID=A0ABT2KA85_9RHOB|nr:amino acid adenylation domain-containing protein [Paracoccus sp. YLB-12]MCT4332750.1 amino acid adenylation domain-containing protein [Paracoccus sp. YLB-12]